MLQAHPKQTPTVLPPGQGHPNRTRSVQQGVRRSSALSRPPRTGMPVPPWPGQSQALDHQNSPQRRSGTTASPTGWPRSGPTRPPLGHPKTTPQAYPPDPVAPRPARQQPRRRAAQRRRQSPNHDPFGPSPTETTIDQKRRPPTTRGAPQPSRHVALTPRQLHQTWNRM